jgi:hypothetical protein
MSDFWETSTIDHKLHIDKDWSQRNSIPQGSTWRSVDRFVTFYVRIWDFLSHFMGLSMDFLSHFMGLFGDYMGLSMDFLVIIWDFLWTFW